MFNMITKEKREDLESAMCELAIEQFRKEVVEGEYYVYEVKLQDILFRTIMCDDQLKLAARYAIDILEEFKKINNSGMNRTKLNEIVAKNNETCRDQDEDFNEIFTPIKIMEEISTEKIDEIKQNIACLYGVGGTYWLLISNPCLISALYAVYESIVDNFDDEKYYSLSAYFLFRSIMRVKSEQLNDE